MGFSFVLSCRKIPTTLGCDSALASCPLHSPTPPELSLALVLISLHLRTLMCLGGGRHRAAPTFQASLNEFLDCVLLLEVTSPPLTLSHLKPPGHFLLNMVSHVDPNLCLSSAMNKSGPTPPTVSTLASPEGSVQLPSLHTRVSRPPLGSMPSWNSSCPEGSIGILHR